MTTMPAVLIGTAAYKSLKPELRRCYREIEPDKQGNTRFQFDLHVGENFEGLKDHSDFGPLVRALHRQQAEGADLKAKIADLEATRAPADYDPELWARRHELLGDHMSMQSAHAEEVAKIERDTAAEITKLRSEREKMQQAITARDREHALRECLRECGANPKYDKAIIAQIEADVIQLGDSWMVKSQFGTRTLYDAVQAFLQSDEGSAYALPDAPRRGVVRPRHDGTESFSQRVKRLR